MTQKTTPSPLGRCTFGESSENYILGTGQQQTITLEWKPKSGVDHYRYKLNDKPASWTQAHVIPCPYPCAGANQSHHTFTLTLNKGEENHYEVAGIKYINDLFSPDPYIDENVWSDVSTDASATSYTVEGLANEGNYSFRIRAANASGFSGSTYILAKPKAPPAAPAGSNRVRPKRRRRPILDRRDGRRRHRLRIPVQDDRRLGRHVDAHDRQRQQHNVPPSNRANQRRRATPSASAPVSQYGPTAPSNETTATPATAPAKPTILTATPMDGAVDLTWTDPSNNTITGWQYQYKTTGNYTAWQRHGLVPSLARNRQDFRSHRDESAYRPVAPARQRLRRSEVPAAQAAAGGAGMERVDRHPMRIPMLAGDAGLLHLHRAGVKTRSYTFQIRGVYSNPESLTAFSVRGLTNDAAHTFKIRAINPSGNGDPSNESTAATPKPAPSAPTLTTATPFDAEVALAWTYPSDGAPTDRMEYSGDNGATWTVAKTEVVNSKGQIGFDSNNWNVNQSFTAKLPAAPPSDVKITFSQPGATFTPSRLTFTTQNWNTPQTVNVKLLKEPQAEPCPICPPGWTPVLPIQYVLTINDRQIWDNATSDTATGLTNSTEYTFVVRGVNAYGNGPASNAIKATPIAKPAKPTGFDAAPKHQSAILSWTDPNNDTIAKWQYSQKTRQQRLRRLDGR